VKRLRGEVAPLAASAPELAWSQILDEKGVAAAHAPQLSAAQLIHIYRGMLREAGAAIFRGLPLRTYVAQIFGNANDVAQGRQLPCHPGTRQSRYLTMSSCVATQLPHAVGIAWAAKLEHDDCVVLACLGDGATSASDFHIAANFAGVYRLPVVFFCQNNQWAISTPVAAQSASPTIAIKAAAYGFPGARCDGNDVLAVYAAVSDAAARARRGDGPTLVEALTYRVSAHSSSDDPTRYRDERVTDEWKKKDPIERLRTYLLAQRLLTADADIQLRAEIDAEVRDAIANEEPVAPPPLASLVEDVFAEVPWHLREQLAEIEPLPRQKRGGAPQ
jgi:pyruvate dehydrogenase E1 component alpha subunit/2-oxoisovalerate dehydrogenase E1 component alpha subunit